MTDVKMWSCHLRRKQPRNGDLLFRRPTRYFVALSHVSYRGKVRINSYKGGQNCINKNAQLSMVSATIFCDWLQKRNLVISRRQPIFHSFAPSCRRSCQSPHRHHHRRRRRFHNERHSKRVASSSADGSSSSSSLPPSDTKEDQRPYAAVAMH